MDFKTELEWLTSNTRVAYPFVEEVGPLQAGEDNFSDLTVDAYVMYKGQVEQSVKLAYLDDPTASPRVLFKFEDDTVAFDSLGGSVASSVFGPWRILEWVNETYGIARLLLKDAEIGNYSWPAQPADAFLVAFATQTKPLSLRTLTKDPFTFDGTIEILAGFNTALVPTVNPEFEDSAPQRGRNFVRIDLSAGLGEGVYLDCEQYEPPIFTINGISPDENGNLALDPRDCYRLEVPIDEMAQGGVPGPPWHIKSHTLQIDNDCAPCCDCEDYIYVYDELERSVYNRAKILSDRIYTVRDAFAQLVAQAAQEKSCRETVTVDLKVIPRHGWTATIQVTIRNNQPCPVDYIYLDYEFGGVTRAEYVSGSGYFNSKTSKQERFDPTISDPCALISPTIVSSSSSWAGGNVVRKWRETKDTCAAYPHYYVTYTDSLLGTDVLTVTYQVYFAAYGTRAEGAVFEIDLSGFVGSTPVSAAARAPLLGPYNKE